MASWNSELPISVASTAHRSTDLTSYAAVTATTPVPPQCYASKGNVYFLLLLRQVVRQGFVGSSGEYGFIRDRQEGSEIAFGNGNLGTGATLGLLHQDCAPAVHELKADTHQPVTASVKQSWVDMHAMLVEGFRSLPDATTSSRIIEMANLGNPNRTTVYATQVITPGINYYMGERTKIQVNYNFVELPTQYSNGTRNFHPTQSNSLLINMQVAF